MAKNFGDREFKDSAISRELNDACAKLQGIVEGYFCGNNGKKLWGSWKRRLEEAYDVAQSVLDEIQENNHA